MGEWLSQVPVKLDARMVARLDEDVTRFLPFCQGRSAMIRVLLEVAYNQIDNGSVDWTLEGLQKVLGVPRVQESQRIQSVPGTTPRKR